MQQCLNANLLLTSQKTSLQSSSPGRSVTGAKSPPQAEPRNAQRRVFELPHGSLTLFSVGADAGCCCLVMFSARHQQILFFCSWE